MKLKLPSSGEACERFQELLAHEKTCNPREVNKPLILYGAGDLGKLAKDYFENLGIPFMYVVDAHPERYLGSSTWKDIRILSPEEVPFEDKNNCLLSICIATSSYKSITEPLLKDGWRDVVHFYDISEAYIERYPLGNGWLCGTLDSDDIKETEYVLSNWSDDISRAHHLHFIAWHKLRKELIFDGAPITIDNRFFIPQILSSLHKKEVFIDGGAYHGDVSLRFIKIAKDIPVKIIAIEPDHYNINMLNARLNDSENPIPAQINIIECALGNKAEKGNFLHGLGYASQLSPNGNDLVEVKTLDEMDIPSTFIKFHLEGGEYNALLGSMIVINRYRPLLAVTTYHNRDGLWRTPSLLMKNLADYVFLLRLHSWSGTGCVLYAIPNEIYKF